MQVVSCLTCAQMAMKSGNLIQYQDKNAWMQWYIRRNIFIFRFLASLVSDIVFFYF